MARLIRPAHVLAWLVLVLDVAVSSFSGAAGPPNGRRVLITLPEQPPSRVYCDLRREGTDEQVRVEFDPAVSSRLSRSVTVDFAAAAPDKPAKWSMKCSSEPKFQMVQSTKDGVSAPINVAWDFGETPVALALTSQEAVSVTVALRELVLNASNQKLETRKPNPGITITAKNPSDVRLVTQIRGLGFAGIMTEGNHHAPHHLAIARGDSTPHGR